MGCRFTALRASFFPIFPFFFSSPKHFLFLAKLHHREPCERCKTKKEEEEEVEEKEEEEEVFFSLDETESYSSSSAALFYLLSFNMKSHPHQLVVEVEEGGGLSVFTATFSKSSIDAV